MSAAAAEPELPAALTDRTAALLQLALARAQRRGEEALAELGVTGREYGVLALLEHGFSGAQHRLGATLGIDRTSTAHLLARLEARGLLARGRDPADRRANLLRLTPDGQRLRSAAAAVLDRCEEEFLAPLTDLERGRLHRALLRLLEG